MCDDFRFMAKRKKSQNIVNRLYTRELWGARKPATNFHVAREFYLHIYPNLNVINVEKPSCFLRKFTPDGKHLVAFSFDQTSLEIYKYMGCSAAADLLSSWQEEVVPNLNTGIPNTIRSCIFNRLFKLKSIVNMGCNSKQLNRECSLFTNDGKYVIVGATTTIPDDLRPNFYEIYTSNEAITPTIRCPLEDCTLYLVDVQNGRVSDRLDFKADKIILSHNQGLYLFGTTFAVLSIQHQTIHVYEIHDGTFIKIRTIGRFCNGEEQSMLNLSNAVHRPFRENSINTLKHKFLVFLYKITKQKNCKLELRRFYQFFDQYNLLRMWKMQLLDDDHLLIKYASEDVVTLKTTEPNSQPSYFAIYNFWECSIVAIFDNGSQELLYLFENFCDLFRNARVFSDSHFTCSPSNNMYAKLIQQRFKQTIKTAKGGGLLEATKRILAQLPISAQSYSSSPYLDLSLFSYDDKWVSIMERPKASGEFPIRFYGRDCGLLKFKICPGLQTGRSQSSNSRRLVAFTFHPIEPFAISVQRINTDYIVNFHIRHDIDLFLAGGKRPKPRDNTLNQA